jgi:hypothetical protein
MFPRYYNVARFVMRPGAIIMLVMLACGLLLSRCGGDLGEDLLPVHVRVHNTDTEDFQITIGPHDFGTVASGVTTGYREFSPLGAFPITITGSAATTNLRTGNGGYFTLIIDDKDSIANWDVEDD